MQPFATFQAARAEYDARSGLGRHLGAVRSPVALSPADIEWVRAKLARRRMWLEILASRLGIDPIGAMLEDELEAALRRVNAAAVAYGAA